MEELWYHVDVNSAFLSWSAAHEIWIKGGDLDLRTVPSVIGGNEKDRHGIVLAKSGPAARFGIRTGETLVEARNKCPGLIIAPPEYDLYALSECHRAACVLLQQKHAARERRIHSNPYLSVSANPKGCATNEQIKDANGSIHAISGCKVSLLHNKLTVAREIMATPCVAMKTYGRSRFAT